MLATENSGDNQRNRRGEPSSLLRDLGWGSFVFTSYRFFITHCNTKGELRNMSWVYVCVCWEGKRNLEIGLAFLLLLYRMNQGKEKTRINDVFF